MTKKKWITNVYPRDRKSLLAISRCGHVRESQLKEFIKDKRIKNYLKDNLIEKDGYLNTKTNQYEVGYKLTREGRTFVENNFGFKEHQVAQTPNHDFGISDKYFSLTEEQQNTWQTETQLRDRFEEELQKMREEECDRWAELTSNKNDFSTPDGAFFNGEVEVVFEVVTNSYGKQEIQAKENFVQVIGGDLQYGYR